MNRYIKPWIKLGEVITFAVLLFSPAFLGFLLAPNHTAGSDPQGDGTQLAVVEPTASQTTGSIDVNMSLLATGTYKAYTVTLSRGNVYNFTATSAGAATFDVTLVHNVTVTNYFNQETTSEYSDDILVAAGVPWWGGYNAWNTISFSSRVTQGATVSSGGDKSYLIYIDSSYPQSTIVCTLLVILKSTSDTNNNLLELTWNSISLAIPAMTINYTNIEEDNVALFQPESTSLVKFTTQSSALLTNTILNETVFANSSLTLVRWQKDLSGNVKRITTVGIGVTNDVYVPSFRNIELDGSVLPGFILNTNPSAISRLSWNFSAISDPSVSLSRFSLQNDSVINFTYGGLNRAFRFVELAGTTFFDIELTENIVLSQAVWNVAVQFIAIGRDNYDLYNLNLMGVNESERATIFTTNQETSFQNVATSFTANQFDTYRYWISGYGNLAPTVSTPTGTQKLGMIITATPTMDLFDFSCLVDFTVNPVPNLDSNEELNIGTKLGFPYDSFKTFYVRQFTFQDYQQYKWGIQSFNATPVSADANLYCNDGSVYPRNLNNALISTQFSTASLTGSLTLQYEIENYVQQFDQLLVYVKNDTGTHLVATEDTTLTTPVVRTIPTSGSFMRIIFNFTTNNQGTGLVGPIIDDVRVGNSTYAAFSDDFQGTLASKWTQQDNNGGSALYWHIASDSTTFNRPAISIIYPNQISTMVGYYAEPAFSGVPKEVFSYNPTIQSRHVAYVVIMADGSIVQNFSAIVAATAYDPVEIQDGTIVTSNLEYTQIGITYPLADFYQYYYVDLEPGYRYDITVQMEGLSVLYIDGNVITELGTNATSEFNRFYGFFIVNLTYTIEPTAPGRVYIKFATVAPDSTFTILFTKVSTTPEFPWLLTIGIASIAVNVLFGYVLAYNRRVLTLPKRRNKMKI